MPISPLDIQQQRFRTKFGGGLDKVEVDAFLNAVAAEVERLLRENSELKEEQRSLKRLLDDHRSREEALKETMITAQRVTEEIKKGADKEADIIIGRAELEAERIQEQAVQKRSDLLLEIAELKRQRTMFMAQLRGILGTHAKLLDVAEEENANESLAVVRQAPQQRPARTGPAPVSTVPAAADDPRSGRSSG